MSEQAQQTDNGKPALPAIADDEIQKIRAKGAAMVAYRAEVKSIAKQIEGLEWGSGTSVVKGSRFSDATRYAIAQFCRITRANPLTHIDILGGKPYLNASYWSDLLNSEARFHHFEQQEISQETEDALRARAQELREIAEPLEKNDANRALNLTRAIELEQEADEIAQLRRHYRVPEWATVAYETTIYRFINAAPMDAIRRGEITDLDRWIVEVSECNWAGNRPPKKKRDGGTYDPDPIGNDEPEKTARTRSLRRCATRAFSAWLQAYDQQLQRAEETIEAEFTILEEDAFERRALQAGPQGASTDGEPAAAAGGDAEDLPGTREPTPREEPPASDDEAEETWDRDNARKRYFAMLHESGVADSKRKAWQKAQGLPVSTSDWARADYNRAFEALIAPHRDAYFELCREKGVDAEDFAFEEIHGLPAGVADFQKLNARLAEIEKQPAQGELV